MKTPCLPADEWFRTQFTYKSIMNFTDVLYKILLWAVFPQIGYARMPILQMHWPLMSRQISLGDCRVWILFQWKSMFWLLLRPCGLRNVRDCLNTVFWLLWRSRRPSNERVWLNNAYTPPPPPPRHSRRLKRSMKCLFHRKYTTSTRNWSNLSCLKTVAYSSKNSINI